MFGSFANASPPYERLGSQDRAQTRTLAIQRRNEAQLNYHESGYDQPKNVTGQKNLCTLASDQHTDVAQMGEARIGEPARQIA